MTEVFWKIGFDQQEAKKAGKEAGKAQKKETSKKGGSAGGGAFAGGFLGSILGNLLSSVQQLFGPISAIATLLIAALFPLLKPFLILFLKVGLLLVKWLQGAIQGLTGGGGPATTTEIDAQGKEITKAGTGLTSSLFLIGGVITAVLASIAGAPILLATALGVLGGLIISLVGKHIVNALLEIVTFIDQIFNTNFLEPLKTIFEGITNVGVGIFELFKSLLTLDFKAVWESLKKILLGLWQIVKGVFLLAFEILKSVFKLAFGDLSGIGTFVLKLLKDVFTTAFQVLRNIGSFIKNSILGFFGRGGGRDSSVNDAIITPNGDIIRTNPNDFLIATKNPGDLIGGGGSSNVNVTINGGLITDEVARDIGRIIQRDLNLGGRF